MSIHSLSGPATSMVSLALDAAQMRHKAHLTNIANASVPSYVPVRLDFGQALTEARTRFAAGLQDGPEAVLEPEVVPATDAQGRPLGSVEVDTEVAEMMQNTLDYQMLLRGLSRHLSILSMATSDGRR